jgi:CheY-like chemotaxis protein
MTAMPHNPARVLLIEDDRFLRKAAEVRLKRGGYAVTTAADGEEALATIEAVAPDIVLLDLIMPKIQGFEVLRRLKANEATRHIPVIVLTNLSQDADRVRAMEGGAAGYFVKAEMSLDQMAETVARALERHVA